MILPYSQYLNSKPTYFVEKITQALKNNPTTSAAMLAYQWPKKQNGWFYPWKYGADFNDKLHTIRRDEKNRWYAGRLIHFVINNRSKNMWQFAPIVPCVSTQTIRIEWQPIIEPGIRKVEIYIDDRKLTQPEKKQMALNDGFETLFDFEIYFGENFTGKIIHWTNLKY